MHVARTNVPQHRVSAQDFEVDPPYLRIPLVGVGPLVGLDEWQKHVLHEAAERNHLEWLLL